MKPVKPLWGFGWAGWCLVVVALALGAVLLTGYDLRFQILAFINAAFGWRGMFWFVSAFLGAHVYDFPWTNFAGPVMPEMHFGLITMICVLAPMLIHPRRHGWARTGAVVALGVLSPPMRWTLIGWLGKLGPPPPPASMGSQIAGHSALSEAVIGLVAAGVLWWVTRSWRLGLLILALCAAGSWLSGETALAAYASPPWILKVAGTEWWYRALGWMWNPIVLACCLVWSIRARQRVFPEYACQECGYDMRGLAEDRCPECGTDRPRHVVPPEPAAGINSPP